MSENKLKNNNEDLHQQAIDWWDNLEDNKVIEVYKKTGNFRLGGWGHDIGPTEDDVIDMYKKYARKKK